MSAPSETRSQVSATPFPYLTAEPSLSAAEDKFNYGLFLNNQPDALIIQIYSVIKLYIFRASSLPIIRSFSTVHSALVIFMQVFDDRFQTVRMELFIN
jgi:hypothetical protein